MPTSPVAPATKDFTNINLNTIPDPKPSRRDGPRCYMCHGPISYTRQLVAYDELGPFYPVCKNGCDWTRGEAMSQHFQNAETAQASRIASRIASRKAKRS